MATQTSFVTLMSAFVIGLGTVVTTSAADATPGSLADALQILQSKQYIDLTHRFSPSSPVWSGFGQATLSAATDPHSHRPYTIEQDGFRASVYSLVGQYGTHVDPPAHFRRDGTTMDDIPLKDMILPLVVFDATPLLKSDPNHAFSVADIRTWEKTHGPIPTGAFAALRTDMYRDFESNPERFKRTPFPAWSLEAIRFLYEQRKVTATGHESLDTDTTEKMDSEAWILQHNHFQIEAMANLDKVPPTGAVIIVTWPKVANGLGFPARAFAILP